MVLYLISFLHRSFSYYLRGSNIMQTFTTKKSILLMLLSLTTGISASLLRHPLDCSTPRAQSTSESVEGSSPNNDSVVEKTPGPDQEATSPRDASLFDFEAERRTPLARSIAEELLPRESLWKRTDNPHGGVVPKNTPEKSFHETAQKNDLSFWAAVHRGFVAYLHQQEALYYKKQMKARKKRRLNNFLQHVQALALLKKQHGSSAANAFDKARIFFDPKSAEREHRRIIESEFLSSLDALIQEQSKKEQEILNFEDKIAASRKELVRDFYNTHPECKLDRTQLCPMTNEIFDIRTGQTVYK